MRDIMILRVASLCCSAHVRHIPVSPPRIDVLVAEQPAKYVVPESVPASSTDAPPRRGPRYTSHDNRSLIQKRMA